MPLGMLTELDVPRLPVGLAELDRVLGGGIVPGSLVLVGGEPGIGKSTLSPGRGRPCRRPEGLVLYATGEESGGQVHLRARRLGLIGTPAADAVHLLRPNTTWAASSKLRAGCGRPPSSSTRSRRRPSRSSTGPRAASARSASRRSASWSCKGGRHRRRPGRPRHEGGEPRRPQRPWSTSLTRSSRSRRARRDAAARAGLEVRSG